jgi:hypothetical protein
MNADFQTLAQALRVKRENLCHRDRDTADSLLDSLAHWGRWTPRQRALVESLVRRAEKGLAPSIRAEMEFRDTREGRRQAESFQVLRNRLAAGEPTDWALHLFADMAYRVEQRPLTEGQWGLLEKLVKESEERKAHINRPADENLGGSLAPMLVAFRLAGEHLQHPRVRLATGQGLRLILSIAGKTSKHQGQVFVKTAGTAEYLGRIDKDANFWPSRSVSGDRMAQVREALSDFAADPAQAAKAYAAKADLCIALRAAVGRQGEPAGCSRQAPGPGRTGAGVDLLIFTCA